MIRKGYHGSCHIRKVKVVSGASVQLNLVWDISEWKDKIQKRWKEMHVCFFQVCCFAVVQLLISTTPWTAACQAPPSSNISWSLLKFMSIKGDFIPYLGSLFTVYPHCQEASFLFVNEFPLAAIWILLLLFCPRGEEPGLSQAFPFCFALARTGLSGF